MIHSSEPGRYHERAPGDVEKQYDKLPEEYSSEDEVFNKPSHGLTPPPVTFHGKRGRGLFEWPKFPIFNLPKFDILNPEKSATELKKFLMNLVTSHFSNDKSDTVCAPIKEENACNAHEQCSFCRSDVESTCRTIANAKITPPAIYQCSKVSAEDKSSTEEYLMRQFASVIGAEYNSASEQRCRRHW